MAGLAMLDLLAVQDTGLIQCLSFLIHERDLALRASVLQPCKEGLSGVGLNIA